MSLVLDEIPRQAAAFIDSLDRSSLGAFVVDGTALYFHYLSELYRRLAVQMRSDSVKRLSMEYGGVDDLSRNARLRMYALVPTDSVETVLIELEFWWSRHPDMEPKYVASPSNVLRSGVKRLEMIVSHPERYPFFLNEIWDAEFISECLASGVDAEMARGLVGAS